MASSHALLQHTSRMDTDGSNTVLRGEQRPLDFCGSDVSPLNISERSSCWEEKLGQMRAWSVV
eukprot:1626170-Amphidinium_carterae.1